MHKMVDGRRVEMTAQEEADFEASRAPVLSDERARLIRRIDADTDAFIEAVIGKRATEYERAEKEAQAFKDGGYQGSAPATVAGWASAKGESAQWAADNILSTAATWRSTQGMLRTQRLTLKEQARAADLAGVASTATAWDTFMAGLRAAYGV